MRSPRQESRRCNRSGVKRMCVGWVKRMALRGNLAQRSSGCYHAQATATTGMRGRGFTGQFANLDCKYNHEIPIGVLLPANGPVRSTITGTDVDGVREVSGIVAVHEAKAVNAQEPSEGQLRAMRAMGHFFIGSRWIYADVKNPPRTEEESIAIKHGYKRNATPQSAVIWAKTPEGNKWLERYLSDCGFAVSPAQSKGHAIKFNAPYENLETHIFKPTKQWRAIAYIPDYYHLSTLNKYCHPETNFIDPACF